MTNKVFVIVENGFASAARCVELDFTETEFNALPTREQEELIKDAAAEYIDIWLEENNVIEVFVSLGLAGCDQSVETDYTPAQWAKLYPEEREECIIDAAWGCIEYYLVFAKSLKEVQSNHNGIH